MTNSEEPTSTEGISSMKVSENFEAQHQRRQLLNNYANGDFKEGVENGTALAPPTTSGAGVCAAAAAAASSLPCVNSSSSTSSSNDPDSNLFLNGVAQQLPFTSICGEELEHKTEVSDGILYLSNYRLFLQSKQITYNIPLGLVESVECRDIFFLHLNCKDARCIRCTFPNNEAALEMLKRIQAAVSPTKKVEANFAFTFHQKTQSVSEEVKAHLGWDLKFPTPKERFDAEIKRMEFNIEGPWRVSDENKDYELCGSYPTHIIVPCVKDKNTLEQVACFRSARRFPAVVWRHKGNGAVISRCSQPEVGWFGWRSAEDEELVQNIVLACADNVRSSSEPQSKTDANKRLVEHSEGDVTTNGTNGACHSLSSMEVVPDPLNVKKLLILDARSYSTAVVNRARGGGCECLEYYTNCEIQFMNLANIHSIRKSFINVRQLCSLPADQANNWFSQLESCKWLQHMSGLMKAAVTVATAIENESRPVMVHCSDGWDRTPQIVALAEILLDPYYRSLEGFQVLVEREWLDFGHKFADRCGQGVGSEDTNERCPVFLQWLDCLHQLIKQFPTAFEFNLTFLIKLAQHTYSNLFGTFLCNTAKERHALKVHFRTHSIWKFLRAPANYDKFRNHLYTISDQVLWPCCEVRELKLWTQIYLGYDNPSTIITELINPSQESSPAPSVAADCESSDRISNYKLEQSKRSTSCDNLHHPHLGQLQRRKSDPSLSDSVLDLDSEEVESRCLPHTEKMLTAASKDLDRTASSKIESNDSPMSKDSSNFIIGGTEEVSENEETTSEEKAESTVINLKYLKSIESSTDTLVAESGAMTESQSGIQKFVMEINNKTERNELENVRADILRKTENDRVSEGLEINKNDCEETGKHFLDTNAVKELVPCVPDLDQIIGTQQCEVCATSRKLLLEDVTNNTSSVSTNAILNTSTITTTTNNINITSFQSQPSSGSKFSSYTTPFVMHSRTPSNGITATPEELLKSTAQEKLNLEVPNASGTKLSYDVDGLEPLHDEVQIRLNVIISSYKGKIDNLQKELQMYRDALTRQVCHKCTHHMVERPDDAISVADSMCSAEHQSVGHESHSSEISWEAVDERDTRPPLWLPDYCVDKCMGCEAKFWLGKRKHHCRSCGKVFCADCSDNAITIPSEQLFTPVRVCSSCFNRLSNHGQNGTTSSPSMNGNGHAVNGTYNSHLDTSRVNHNGLHRGSSTSEYTPSSDSPKSNSVLQRRLSEELAARKHPNWGKTNPEVHVCNGSMKLKTNRVSNLTNEYPTADSLVGDANLSTNGHSFYE